MRYILTIILVLFICLPVFAASDEERIYGDPVIIYNGDLRIGYNSQTGEIWFFDGSSNKVIITVPALAADWTLTLPTTDGGANEVLQTDGSGNCSWAAVAGGHNSYEIVDDDADTTAYVDDAVPTDADTFVVKLAGAQRMLLSGTGVTLGTSNATNFTSTGITWNTSSTDQNFIVYGDTDTQLFWVDAGLDRVGIGTNAPGFLLDVDGTFSANSIDVNDAYVLPTADGTADFFLTTDGAGTASWVAAPGAGGSDNDWDVNGTDLEPTTDGNDVVLTAGETLGISSGAAGNEIIFTSVTADADSRFSITADGTLGWADGTNPVDTALYRSAADTLYTVDRLSIAQAPTTGNALSVTRDLASASTDSPVVYIVQDNVGDDQDALFVQQDGGAHGVEVTATTGIGVKGTSTSNSGVTGVSTDQYGVEGQSTNSHGVYGNGGAGNDDYGIYAADKTKIAAWGDWDERSAVASPPAAVPPAGDGRLYCVDDDTFTFVNDAGMAYGYSDQDHDTKIQVEEGDDDDTFRVDCGGSEEMTLTASAANFNGTVECDTKYIIDGTDGIDAASITLITDVDFNTMQVKYRTATWEGGILTAMSAESAWTAAPLVP